MKAAVKNKYRANSPAKASLWYTASLALERGSSIIFTPLLTRILTPEEYGLYPLYISWMGLFTIFCTLEISGSAIYKGLLKFHSKDEFISSALGLISFSSLVTIVLYIIFRNGINAATGLSFTTTLILITQIFLSGIQNIYFSKCRYGYKYKSITLLNILSAVFSPILTLLLVKSANIRAEARILSPLIVSAAISIPLFTTLISRGKRLFSKKSWFYLLKFTLPLLPHFISASLCVQIGKIAVAKYFGEGELAKYSVAFSLGFILSVLTTGIYSALNPWINRKLSQKNEAAIGELSKKLFFLLSCAALMFLCLAPELFSIMAPSAYGDALLAVYPISISVIFAFPSNIFSSVIGFFEKNAFTTASSICAAALSVSLNFALTAKLGYVFAALIQAATSLILLSLNATAVYAIIKKSVFPTKSLLFTINLTVLFAGLACLFRKIFAARVMLLLAIIAIGAPSLSAVCSLAKERKC